MLTIEETAVTLGMSPRQLRRRLEVTAPLIDPYIRRGEKNRVLLDGSAIEILRAVEDSRANGRTVKQAMAAVADSLQGNEPVEEGRGRSGTPENMDPLRELIEELRRDRDHWRTLALKLEDRVAELTPLALPRRRRWFSWIRGRGVQGQTV